MITQFYDPSYDSKRTKRSQAAASSIPTYVGKLRREEVALTQESVEKLYREYRAFHGSPGMYPMEIEDAKPNPDLLSRFEFQEEDGILFLLEIPTVLDRRESLAALCALHGQVQASRVVVRKYALA